MNTLVRELRSGLAIFPKHSEKPCRIAFDWRENSSACRIHSTSYFHGSHRANDTSLWPKEKPGRIYKQAISPRPINRGNSSGGVTVQALRQVIR
jgi:hypothetical protein